MKCRFILVLFLLNGCAAGTVKQADFKCFIALGAQVKSQTDELLHNDRPYVCDDNLRTRFGCELEGDKWAVVADHVSSVLCGGINDKPELYEMNIWIQREFFGD